MKYAQTLERGSPADPTFFKKSGKLNGGKSMEKMTGGAFPELFYNALAEVFMLAIHPKSLFSPMK